MPRKQAHGPNKFDGFAIYEKLKACHSQQDFDRLHFDSRSINKCYSVGIGKNTVKITFLFHAIMENKTDVIEFS